MVLRFTARPVPAYSITINLIKYLLDKYYEGNFQIPEGTNNGGYTLKKAEEAEKADPVANKELKKHVQKVIIHIIANSADAFRTFQFLNRSVSDQEEDPTGTAFLSDWEEFKNVEEYMVDATEKYKSGFGPFDYELLQEVELKKMLTFVENLKNKVAKKINSNWTIVQATNNLTGNTNVFLTKLEEMESKLKQMVEIYGRNFPEMSDEDKKQEYEYMSKAHEFVRDWNNKDPNYRKQFEAKGGTTLEIKGGRKSRRKSKLNKRRKTNRRRR